MAISPGPSRVVGSESNEQARALLRKELDGAGYHTEIQSAVSCGRWGTCAFVNNLIATKAGTDPEAGAVLLMAHLDSVPCSPGAGDDGFGAAAVIDAAHALAAEPLRRTLIVLISDAEETGLLGADAFMRHPLATRVRGVVNVDSRGSSGPSAMFETTPGNAWLVDLFAKTAVRPVTSSLFYEVYRRMPNDTDFTVVKPQAQGVNIANLAQVERYHTSLDDTHADPRTLAHHAANAQAMTRALANAGPELDARSCKDAVWFDVLALFVVRWPASWSLPLAVLSLSLIVVWTIRRRTFGWRGLVAPLGALVGATILAILVGALLHAFGALPVAWIAHPAGALISLHFACFAAGLAISRLLARDESTWSGTWLVWSALGVVVAAAVPGACFLFVVPALVAGLTGGLREDLRAAIPSVAAAVVWLPLVVLVYEGLGIAVPVAAALPSIVLVSTWPIVPRRVLAAPAVIAAVAFIAALLVPRFSVAVPQRVNVVYRQDARASHVYLAASWGPRLWGDPPPAMLEAMGPHSVIGAPLPWAAAVPEATVTGLPSLVGPQITMQERSASQLRIHVTSPRGAKTLMVVTDATSAIVEGVAAPMIQQAFLVRGIPASGVDITLANARSLTVLDLTYGVPSDSPIAVAVRDARPPTAVQTQEGDLTVVSTELPAAAVRGD